ncbi:Hpt domain-containing protein [Flavitalea sp.]|nr:Hpt domain-containing protein [Flavitalea sp.]
MSFNFNPKIDRDFIISMYEEDYPYISEVFATTLGQLIPDIEIVKKAFTNRDLESLRKQVHKIKPAFGFAGLRDTEALCQQFEDNCLSVSSTEALADKYETLIISLGECCNIIQQEIEKLKAHNN